MDRAEWHRVVVFQRVAENCAQYLTKGSLVYVEGSLQTRKWQDQQGQDRYSTEIKAQRVQFLDRRGGGDSATGAPSGSEGGYAAPRRQAPAGRRNSLGNNPVRMTTRTWARHSPPRLPVWMTFPSKTRGGACSSPFIRVLGQGYTER